MRFVLDGGPSYGIELLGNDGNGHGRLRMGSGSMVLFGSAAATHTSTFDTGIGRTSAGVAEINNGTSGTLRDLRLRNLITAPVTVATLTAAATAGAGARSFVTDASLSMTAGVGTTVAGGGANKVPVYSDGANWLIG